MIVVTDIFQDVVARTAIALTRDLYFEYGHETEISRIIQSKDRSITMQDKKFPVIWLVMDFVERFDELGEVELPDLNIIIATQTRIDDSTRERYEKNFKQVLYPIYVEFLNQMTISGYFGGTNYPHDKIDRPLWDGAENRGLSNIFSSPIDAIQIRGLKLTLNEELCEKFKLTYT